MRLITIIFILISIGSCDNPAREEKSGLKNGLIKNFDDKGNLKTEVTYKAGLKHGRSAVYYDGSDQVMLEMYYQDGKRSGTATKYYESGNIYAETPYENDEVNGVVKLYFRNGNLKAEIPYNYSKPGLGLKEYNTDGVLKANMPRIEKKLQNISGQYVYYFDIKNCSNANFFIGALLNNKYLIEEPPFVEILPKRNGEAIFGFSESQIGHKINIICKCQTTSKNPYVVREVIELGKP